MQTSGPILKMKPNAQAIAKIADLAALQLSSDELEAAESDFNSILGYFDGLAAVDTSSVSPTLGVQPHTNVFRADQVVSGVSAPDAVSNAPTKECLVQGDGSEAPHHFFRIPKVLD
jgi:aspartyl/glutamyl-tRNA(Asn/Gln) amidotransferase C subunit